MRHYLESYQVHKHSGRRIPSTGFYFQMVHDRIDRYEMPSVHTPIEMLRKARSVTHVGGGGCRVFPIGAVGASQLIQCLKSAILFKYAV